MTVRIEVRDLPSAEIVARSDMTLADVAWILCRQRPRYLPVVGPHGDVVGFIDDDCLRWALTLGRPPSEIKVTEIMSPRMR